MTVPPSEALSSCEAQGVQIQREGTRLQRVERMEAVNGLQTIHPGGVVPDRALARPLDQVLELLPAAEYAGV